MKPDATTLLADAVAWAREAGAIQRSYFRSDRLQIDTKSNIADVVTTADRECEALLLERIASRYPTHSVLGEESGAHDKAGDYRWVVDPLDGTNNFSQGLPLFCVSIGVEYKGATIAGVVYAPYLNELYQATAGGGAFLNGEPIRVAKKRALNESVVASGFPYDKDTNPDNNVANAARIIPQVRGFRRGGSAAYDLCCVAAGWLDGYWEFNLNPWDVSAGTLIVREAGGIVEPFRKERGVSVVAANRQLLPLLKANLDSDL